MNAQGDVGGVGAHLDGQHRHGDQVARVRPGNAAADDPAGRLLEQHLGQPFGPAEGVMARVMAGRS
jgi:hypothetical protein